MDEKSPVPTAHPSLTRNLSPHPASTAVIGSKSRIALRLFGSISLITIHLGVLRAYQEKGIVPGEQNVFQAITQGIAIFLGFNVTSSLKELATYLEPLLIYDPALWRVERGASREHAQTLIRLTRPGKAGHEEEEESEIYWDNKERFSIGSFQDLIYLAVFSVGMRWARFGIIVWLLLAGLGPSVIVALIGLNYNYESTNELGTTPGAAVNMTAFTEFLPLDESVFEKHVLESGLNFTPVQGADTDGDGVSDGELSENAKYAIAHTYGEMSMVLPTHDSHEHNYDPSDVYVEQLPGEEPQWKYNFREMNSEQMDGTERVLLQHRTSRSVTVMPKCEYFPIVEGQFGLRTDAPEDEAEWDEDVMIETPEGKLEIGLFTMRHADSATWTYILPELEARATIPSCGPRCARIYAAYHHHKNPSGSDKRVGHFFNCTITVSPMLRADDNNDNHLFPNDIARILAASIALSSDGDAETGDYSHVTYHSGIAWGNLTSEVRHTENLAGRFAVGAIAMMDKFNNKNTGPGESPWVGARLVVKWMWVWVNTGVIAVVQAVCALAAVWYYRAYGPKKKVDETVGGEGAVGHAGTEAGNGVVSATGAS